VDALLTALTTHGLAGIVIALLVLAVAWLGGKLVESWAAQVALVQTVTSVVAESNATRTAHTSALNELTAIIRQLSELQRVRDEVERREAAR
jgi:hypothetical protein